MKTEKSILTEVLGTSMKSQDESEREKTSLDAFLERKKLDLERWTDETEEDYHHRLFSIHATQIGLISAYEKEKELERCRKNDAVFAYLLEGGTREDEIKVKNVICELQEEVKSYIQNYKMLLKRKAIQEKLKDLESITEGHNPY